MEMLKPQSLKTYAKFLMLAIPLAVFSFLFVAMAMLFVISFYTYDSIHRWETVFTLENYVRFLTSPAYLRYLWITLDIGATSAALAVLMGYPLAYSIARSRSKTLKKILLMLLILIFFYSTIIRIYGWYLSLASFGIITSIFKFLGLPSTKLLFTKLAVIIGLTHWLLPFAIFSMVSSIKNIEPECEDAARSLGANEITTFLRITLPLSLPGITSAISLCFALGVSAFMNPAILGGGVWNMLSNLIFARFGYVLNFPLGASMSIILLFISLMIAYGINKFLTAKMRL